ncbi:lipid II flippase Amj family protein [Tsuneonella sp. HG249]
MDTQLFVICALTFGINLIGALAYAARIAGVRTRRIAMSFALFNVLVLVSRTANGFLGPFLAKRIERRLLEGGGESLAADFRIVLGSATAAVIVGIVLVPTAQRLFARAIGHFQRHRSTGKLILRSATPAGLRTVREEVSLPSRGNLSALRKPLGVSWTVLFANAGAQALLTVGVVASLYAGYLAPEFRVTASQLSAVINGFATILLFALIDPQLSVMTDDVVEGRIEESLFRRTIVWISFSRLAGTALAQAVFLPAAMLIAGIAVYV